MPRKSESRRPGSIDDALDAGGIGITDEDLIRMSGWDGGESSYCRRVLDGDDPKSMSPSQLRRIAPC